MRESSKEHKVDSVRRERVFQAELEDMTKGQQVMAFSVRMLAYTYTGLCSDRELWEAPGNKERWS